MSNIKSAHIGQHGRSQEMKTFRVFENQVCQWLSIRIRRILECLSLQSNLLTKSKNSENLSSLNG